jgi:glycopeptide antibiotics resistance protein
MAPSAALYLSLMIFTATILYIFFISIINRKISTVHINILAVLYFGITIELSFLKTISNFNGINLNPLNIITDFRNYFSFTLLLVITNMLLYLPMGLYIRFKVKISSFRLFIGFILYIFFIEAMQYILHKGIFDVNDIILNSLGFLIGVLCCEIIMKPYDKRKIKSNFWEDNYENKN